MAEHTFDATITLIYEQDAGDPGKRHAADTILEIASEYGMAVSLHDEGTLNVKELSSKLDGIKRVLAGADDREWSVALLQVAEIVGFEVPK